MSGARMIRKVTSVLLIAVCCTQVGRESWSREIKPGIPEASAVRAILGEAGQSYEERLAIAFAIVNRGHLKGVYGRLEAPTATQWQEGSRAWHTALNGLETDIVHGADHWLSDWDLKNAKPRLTAFRFKMKETAYIGSTHFYKEVR